MSTADSVSYVFYEDVYIIKFHGDIRFSMCTGLDKFIQKIFSQDNVFPAIVDLINATALDSTALGVLAQVAIKMRENFDKRATLLIKNNDLLTILKSVSFDRVFNILIQDESKNYQYQELEPFTADEKDFSEHVLRAHQHLMELSPVNREKFKEVTAALERHHSVTYVNDHIEE